MDEFGNEIEQQEDPQDEPEALRPFKAVLPAVLVNAESSDFARVDPAEPLATATPSPEPTPSPTELPPEPSPTAIPPTPTPVRELLGSLVPYDLGHAVYNYPDGNKSRVASEKFDTASRELYLDEYGGSEGDFHGFMVTDPKTGEEVCRFVSADEVTLAELSPRPFDPECKTVITEEHTQTFVNDNPLEKSLSYYPLETARTRFANGEGVFEVTIPEDQIVPENTFFRLETGILEGPYSEARDKSSSYGVVERDNPSMLKPTADGILQYYTSDGKSIEDLGEYSPGDTFRFVRERNGKTLYESVVVISADGEEDVRGKFKILEVEEESYADVLTFSVVLPKNSELTLTTKTATESDRIAFTDAARTEGAGLQDAAYDSYSDRQWLRLDLRTVYSYSQDPAVHNPDQIEIMRNNYNTHVERIDRNDWYPKFGNYETTDPEDRSEYAAEKGNYGTMVEFTPKLTNEQTELVRPSRRVLANERQADIVRKQNLEKALESVLESRSHGYDVPLQIRTKGNWDLKMIERYFPYEGSEIPDDFLFKADCIADVRSIAPDVPIAIDMPYPYYEPMHSSNQDKHQPKTFDEQVEFVLEHNIEEVVFTEAEWGGVISQMEVEEIYDSLKKFREAVGPDVLFKFPVGGMIMDRDNPYAHDVTHRDHVTKLAQVLKQLYLEEGGSTDGRVNYALETKSSIAGLHHEMEEGIRRGPKENVEDSAFGMRANTETFDALYSAIEISPADVDIVNEGGFVWDIQEPKIAQIDLQIPQINTIPGLTEESQANPNARTD